MLRSAPFRFEGIELAYAGTAVSALSGWVEASGWNLQSKVWSVRCSHVSPIVGFGSCSHQSQDKCASAALCSVPSWKLAGPLSFRLPLYGLPHPIIEAVICAGSA